MSYNEQEFERLVNGETLDSDEITYKLALSLIKLAMIVLQERAVEASYGASLLAEALDVLHLYGNWREEGPVRALLTPEEYRRFLIKDNGGHEEEADAEIFYEQLEKKLTPPDQPHTELWYQDGEKGWYLLEAYKGITRWTFYFEHGVDPKNMQPLSSSDCVYSKQLDDLIHQVREKYSFDLYCTPLDQWMLTPHGDIH